MVGAGCGAWRPRLVTWVELGTFCGVMSHTGKVCGAFSRKGVAGGRRGAWEQELWPSVASEGVLSVVADSVRRAAWLPTAAQRRAYLAAVPQARTQNTVPAPCHAGCKPKTLSSSMDISLDWAIAVVSADVDSRTSLCKLSNSLDLLLFATRMAGPSTAMLCCRQHK